MHLQSRSRLTFDVVEAEPEPPGAALPSIGSETFFDRVGRAIMEFHARYVSVAVSVGGDYCQAAFEFEQDSEQPDSASPYLLIQRNFEMPYDGSCYLETHDERYCGHFLLRRIEFTPDKLAIELDRPTNNLICVSFRLTASEFEDTSRVMKIISGEIEPEPE